MSETHATDLTGHNASAGGDHHNPSDHGGDHGHDDHAHGEAALGPIDVAAWAAGILGVAIAIVIAACLSLGTTGLG
jgi:ABC-type Zn2+ transport system substrate-binding protein/surface adhesin